MKENPQRTIERIVSSDTTKSVKIRALAEAGLLRTEIRDLLGVRYQHVRKVLIDAGINSGTKQTATVNGSNNSPRVIKDQSAPDYEWRDLFRFGFERIGEWTLVEDGISLDGLPPHEPGVYAFVLDEQVVYIGLTQTALKTRMGHYRRGHVRQKTSARVKELIQQALAKGGKVEVLTCIPGTVEWNDLPLQLGPSLEASLIGLIRPPWNIQGKRQVT